MFKTQETKKKVIPWDPDKVLALWKKRTSSNGESLPDIFSLHTDITQAPQNIVGRNKLVLKAKKSDELMYYTKDDE